MSRANKTCSNRRYVSVGWSTRIFAVSLLAGLLVGCVGTFGRYDATPVSVSNGAAISLTNSYRRSHGLSGLRSDPKLAAAARQHAMTMARQGKIGHRVGGSLPSRVSAVGYSWGRVSENLGKGYPSLNSAFEGWKQSTGHRKNLLNQHMKVAGFGAARSGKDGAVYWTMIMAAPPERRRR